MKEMIIACATDDGKMLINRHFGDANRYDLYKLTKETAEFLETISNTVPEEQMHADPEKARNIGSLLKPAGVQALVSGQFGQNITRVKKKFVPIVVRDLNIEAALTQLQQRYEEIVSQYEKGEERKHIVLKKVQPQD